MEVTEDVANPGAGNRLNGAATLPDAEGHLQVLAAPAVHLLIVAAHLPEIPPIHGKQSTSHGGTVSRTDLPLLLAFPTLALLLPLRQIDPVEVAVPLEASHLEGLVAVGAVLEVIGIDHIDDGHQDTGPRLLDALQQGLTPSDIALTMGIQKDEYISRGDSCTGQSGPDQTQAEM